MAPLPYHHGVRVIEVTAGARALRAVATSIIGLVATAGDADADAFPLNRPVLVTDLRTAIGDAGEDGTLARALQAMADQTSPIVVVVRVEEGEDDAETAANVVGGVVDGERTGLQALLDAQSLVGVKPRILGAPGLDGEAVKAALEVIAPKLRAFAYASADGDDVAAAIVARADYGARELMLIYSDFTGWSGNAVARAMGLRARLDEEVGWHKTISNVPVLGVTGITRPVSWDLQDPSTDAGLLNQAQVTTLIRSNGFRFWGSRTCSAEPAFAFESSTRTGQVIADTIADGLMWAADKPLHPSLARDILEMINAEFRSLQAAGRILGGQAWLDDQLNTAGSLASGQLQIDYDYTPVPPLEDLTLRQRITDRYAADFATRVNFGA